MISRPKILFGICLSGALFLVVALVLLSNNLGRVLNNGMVILGPVATRTAWSVREVDLSPWGNEGALTDVAIGNPPGYFREAALTAPRIVVDVETFSYFERVLVLERFRIENAQINADLAGQQQSNLRVLLDNILAASAADTAGIEGYDPDRLRAIMIRRFELVDATLVARSELLGERSVTLPDIVIEDVGVAEGGVNAIQIIQRTIAPIFREALTVLHERVLESGDEMRERLEEAIERLETEAATNPPTGE